MNEAQMLHGLLAEAIRRTESARLAFKEITKPGSRPEAGEVAAALRRFEEARAWQYEIEMKITKLPPAPAFD